jgi:hypothetical protein
MIFHTFWGFFECQDYVINACERIDRESATTISSLSSSSSSSSNANVGSYVLGSLLQSYSMITPFAQNRVFNNLCPKDCFPLIATNSSGEEKLCEKCKSSYKLDNTTFVEKEKDSDVLIIEEEKKEEDNKK